MPMRWLLTTARRAEADVTQPMAVAIALLIQSLTFWAGVWLLRDQRVSMFAWAALYVCCLSVAAALCHRRFARFKPSPGAWLLFALNSALLAALFWGANMALDLVNGAHRPKADWAAQLGGLELWFALCPGVLSVAIAGCVRSAQTNLTKRPASPQPQTARPSATTPHPPLSAPDTASETAIPSSHSPRRSSRDR